MTANSILFKATINRRESFSYNKMSDLIEKGQLFYRFNCFECLCLTSNDLIYGRYINEKCFNYNFRIRSKKEYLHRSYAFFKSKIKNRSF